MSEPLEVPTAVRDRLALALDVDDAVAAQRMAVELRPWFGVVKIGLELFSAAGPDVVQEMIADGYRVFLDLKLADIPTTVERASRVLGALGVSYLSVHAFPGPVTLRAAVDGLAAGARQAGLPAPVVLAVTLLTSDTGPRAETIPGRVAHALESGCGGVVCAGGDLPLVRELAPALFTVVPGTRPAGADHHDQAHAVTPGAAAAAGADLLVIGRPVTAARDRRAAAAAVAEEIAAAVS